MKIRIDKKRYIEVKKDIIRLDELIKRCNNALINFPYRYNKSCRECGKFIPMNKIHNCSVGQKVKDGNFLCGVCKNYLPYEQFPKDKTKKYGIMHLCKSCRSKRGNGNKRN